MLVTLALTKYKWNINLCVSGWPSDVCGCVLFGGGVKGVPPSRTLFASVTYSEEPPEFKLQIYEIPPRIRSDSFCSVCVIL
jgi:hypothetical protein